MNFKQTLTFGPNLLMCRLLNKVDCPIFVTFTEYADCLPSILVVFSQGVCFSVTKFLFLTKG